MPNLFQIHYFFMLSSPCAALICLAMALPQLGSPRPRCQHPHKVSRPSPPLRHVGGGHLHGGLLVGKVVKWSKGLDPCLTLIHIDIGDREHAGALRKKGWARHPWQQLQPRCACKHGNVGGGGGCRLGEHSIRIGKAHLVLRWPKLLWSHLWIDRMHLFARKGRIFSKF